MDRKVWVGICFLAAVGVVVISLWLRRVAAYEYSRLDYWLINEPNAREKVQALSAIAQAVAAVIGLLISLALAVITSVYVLLTRRMAATIATQLEVSLYPMLEFDIEAVNGSVGEVDISIKNKGQVAIKIVFCAFGGKIHSPMHPSGGDVRFESVELKELAGAVLGAGAIERTTVNLHPNEDTATEWGSLLLFPREYFLRLNCTDPRGIVKHSFVRRGDKRVEYKPHFVNPE
jgi:hypothetical protein